MRGMLCLAAAALTIPSAAQAATVTYVATGHVTSVDRRDSQLPAALAGVVTGDVFELRVTLETAGAPDNDSNTSSGEFGFGPGTYSASMRIGTAMGSVLAGAPMTVLTSNDQQLQFPNPPPPFDNIEFIVGGDPAPGFFGPSSVDVNSLFGTAAWGSDGLPTSLSQPLSSFYNSNFSYTSYFNFFGRIPTTISGSITSFQIIPAPGAGLMLAMSGMLASRRRRR